MIHETADLHADRKRVAALLARATVQELETALAAAHDRQSVLLTVKRRANGRTLSEVVLYRRPLAGDVE